MRTREETEAMMTWVKDVNGDYINLRACYAVTVVNVPHEKKPWQVRAWPELISSDDADPIRKCELDIAWVLARCGDECEARAFLDGLMAGLRVGCGG